MSVLSLATKSVGSPDDAYEWYLHSSGAVLADGFQAALGDGTEVPLYLDDLGIGVKKPGGYVSKLRSLASATRIVTLPDAAGTVSLESTSVLAADQETTITGDTASALAVTPMASSTYEIEALLLFKSAATSTSPRFTLTGPSAQTTFVWFEVMGPPTTTNLTTDTGTRAVQQFVAFASSYANATNLPANNVPYGWRVKGMLVTSGTTPASAVGISIASEVNASAVTIMAGSFLRLRKIA